MTGLENNLQLSSPIDRQDTFWTAWLKNQHSGKAFDDWDNRSLSGESHFPMAIVLLVEDEEQVRVLAESYLEEQGHEVLSAGTPDGALALLEKAPQIDVLFTDIDLKGDVAAGINLAREAASRRPHLKVLYTTGRGLTDGMRVRFVENSAFLPKPYTVEELLTTLSVYFKVSPQPRRK